jgi:hypothetical protein
MRRQHGRTLLRSICVAITVGGPDDALRHVNADDYNYASTCFVDGNASIDSDDDAIYAIEFIIADNCLLGTSFPQLPRVVNRTVDHP